MNGGHIGAYSDIPAQSAPVHVFQITLAGNPFRRPCFSCDAPHFGGHSRDWHDRCDCGHIRGYHRTLGGLCTKCDKQSLRKAA